MREPSSFAFLLPKKKHASQDEFWLAMLHILPHAALIVQKETERLLACNDPMILLSGYTRAELDGLHLTSLFPQFNGVEQLSSITEQTSITKTTSVPKVTTPLLQRNQTFLEGEMYLHALPMSEGGYLLIFQPLDESLRTPSSRPQAHPLYQAIQELIAIFAYEDIQLGIQQALRTVAALCHLNVLAYYQINTQKPLLERIYVLGEGEALPKTLPLEILTPGGRAQLWRRGERTQNELHRMARQAGWPFLLSIAIGLPQEAIGFLVMAHTHLYPMAYLEEMAKLVASLIYILTQRHALISNLEEQLHERAIRLQSFEAIAQYSSDGFLWLDDGLHILKINPSLSLILGYDEEEIKGAHIDKVLVGNEDIQPFLEEVIRHAQSTSSLEKRFFRRNGEEFLCKFQAIPILVNGRVEQLLLRVHDLSEVEGLQIQNQRLEQQARLGQAMQIFSHEARNLLNPIDIGLQLLQSNLADNPSLRETVDEVLQDMDRLTDLINAVLDTARSAQYRMEAVNIPLLLKRLLDRMKSRFERYHVTYELLAPPDCPPVRGDVRALEQVFNNLITNALQAMEHQGGKLGIKVSAVYPSTQRGHLEISFADTGPGIPSEMQEKIFHPLVTTKEKGTGLGLAIARLIITSHKGTIHLNSIPGATIFTVSLPLMGPES